MLSLRLALKKVLYYGTQFTDDIDEQEKIKAVNFIILPSIPIVIILAILNISNGKYFLASTNMLVFLIGLITVLINPFKKYDTLKLLLNILLTINCTVQAICYHNGSEYFGIQNLVVVLIFFNELKFFIPSMLFSVAGFVFARYMVFNYPPFIEPIETGRAVFNVTWFLAMMVFGLMYFKRNQRKQKKILEEKNKQLVAANLTKEKIFSIIAHDLRSPIAQLKGSLDLVNKQYISIEEFQQLSSNFSHQVDELRSNLDNLLNWSLTQLNGIQAKPQAFSISALVEEVAVLFKQTTESKQLQLQLTIQPAMVFADPNHIRIVLRNLLSNAVKFSTRGSTVTIKSYISDYYLAVEVSDHGVGMTSEKITKLFSDEPLESTFGTEKEKGTGLGLKLCKEFIDINNGSIQVSSELQKGTVFTFMLPLAK